MIYDTISSATGRVRPDVSSAELEFPPHILKHLNDRNVEKREQAGKYLQNIVQRILERRNLSQIDKIITFFHETYLKSASNKKTGLYVFVAIGSGFKDYDEEAAKFIHKLVPPILDCFNDTYQKIRFNSIKSLFFICKNMYSAVMNVFNDIFEQLIGKIADFDEYVKKAAEQLNNTLKTIITDSLPNYKNFDLKRFMKILTDKMKAVNPFIRYFLIDWLNTIDEIPSVDLLIFLPNFLEDLLVMLSDKEKDVRGKAYYCLKNFLDDLRRQFKEGKLESTLTYASLHELISILIRVAKGKQVSYTKLATINWFYQLFQFFKEQVLTISPIKHKFLLKKVIIQRFDEILYPILSLLSYEYEYVRRRATVTNELLLHIMDNIKKYYPINFSKVIPLLKDMLAERKSSSTSECVLTWMKFLLYNYNDKIHPYISDIITKLVEKLCEGTTKNVAAIILNVSFTEQYFDLLIEKMLNLLYTKTSDGKMEGIFKKFCNLLNVYQTYRAVCVQLLGYKDVKFVEQVVHVMNFLLVTHEGMAGVRKKLRNLKEQGNYDLFRVLFRAFCYNSVSLISLCLLSQYYYMAYTILQKYSFECEMTTASLLEFCKLVNLLESPNFICNHEFSVDLRVQMLERGKYPYLMECMYSLLMILPQGRVYESLKCRVDVVSHVDTLETREIQKYREDQDSYIKWYDEVFRSLNEQINGH